MHTFHKGENKPARVEITNDEEPGAAVTVSAATYRPYDKDGTALADSDNATIVNNGTARVRLEGDIDTTTDKFTADMSFEVKFPYTIQSKNYIAIAHCRMGETKI